MFRRYYEWASAGGYARTGPSSSGGVDMSSFTDAGKISGWALGALEWAVGSGLIKGTSETTISPQGTATRAQAAARLRRFIENLN
jgi:hypothetical protein